MMTNTKHHQGEILVVDDTPANLKLLMNILSIRGYKVRPATGGQQVLDAVAIRQPELILLDIKMPGMDGYEVCRRLKRDKQTREIPVIFISALGALSDRVKGFEVGGVDYITKPFQQEEVLVRVHTHLQLHRMQLNLEALVDERTRELKQAYQSLQENELKVRESEKKYHTIFESSNDAIILLDDTAFIDCNEATLRIFNCSSREEFLNRNPAEWSPATQGDGHNSIKAAKENIATALRKGRNFFEWQHRRANGEEFPTEVLLTPMEVEGRQVLQATVRDITERKQAEETQRCSAEHLQTIQALSLTVEKRDPFTAGHQQRVAGLAAAIAREMGLEKKQVEGIYIGSLLHDIGKIYVPAEILNRPGRLSDVEIAIMQTHPQVGYDIIKGIEFPWPVQKMIIQHHERLDGSGYPKGLTGDKISRESRILAVADVVEAISSHRPYRAARGIEVALEEITKNRDRLYDFDVVDCCLTLFNKKAYSFE